MKVFISWSGTRSKMLAEGLREFLPLVIQKVQPFMSAADIEAGARWPDRLNRELEATDTAIICLTPENRTATWIHYEAGALAKKLEGSRICLCLLHLDKSQVEWPLAQFQLKYADEREIRSIVSSVNAAMAGELDGTRLEQSFNAFWPLLRDKIETIPKAPQEEVPPARDETALLHEMLQILRGVASEDNRGERKLRRPLFGTDLAISQLLDVIRSSAAPGGEVVLRDIRPLVEMGEEIVRNLHARDITVPDKLLSALTRLAGSSSIDESYLALQNLEKLFMRLQSDLRSLSGLERV